MYLKVFVVEGTVNLMVNDLWEFFHSMENAVGFLLPVNHPDRSTMDLSMHNTSVARLHWFIITMAAF